MKSKWNLVSSIIQLTFGVLAILVYIFLTINNENTIKWFITLILSIAFVILGVIGIIDYKKANSKK